MARCPFPSSSTLHSLGLRAAGSKTQSRSAKERRRPPERRAQGWRTRVLPASAPELGAGALSVVLKGGRQGTLSAAGSACDAKATSMGNPCSLRGKRERNLFGGLRRPEERTAVFGEGIRFQEPKAGEARGSPSHRSKRPCYSAGRAGPCRCSSFLPLPRGRSLPRLAAPYPGRAWPGGGG